MTPEILTTISQLRARHLTDMQVVQTLQQQGYHPLEITQALEAADRKQQFNTPDPTGNWTMEQPQNPMKFQPQSVINPQMAPPPQFPGMMPMGGMGTMPPPGPYPPQAEESVNSDEIEELIEAVIEEKWNELRKNIDKIVTWKEQTESKLVQMQQQMKDLRDQFDKVHNAVLGKIGEYDRNIKDVGAQLQAMEKVFSDVLPTFTQNVNTLNRITQRMGGRE